MDDNPSYILNEEQLIWSGQDLTNIPDPRTFSHIDASSILYLDVSYNKISNFEGLEDYSSLDSLILDSNDITDFLSFPHCTNLTTLSLNKNKIADLYQTLENLSRKAPSLRFLSLLGNRGCPHQLSSQDFDDDDYRRYRYYVIYCIPSLKFLDSTPVTEHERKEAQLRGKYLKVITSASHCNTVLISDNPRQTNRQYIPLPMTKVNLSSHRGIYGACRYRYTGKHSEGNRFIRNNDL